MRNDLSREEQDHLIELAHEDEEKQRLLRQGKPVPGEFAPRYPTEKPGQRPASNETRRVRDEYCNDVTPDDCVRPPDILRPGPPKDDR